MSKKADSCRAGSLHRAACSASVSTMATPEPAIVSRELCSPRGTTIRYVLRSCRSSPGGTKSVIEASYKNQSLEALRKLEPVNRKKMTAVCAKNRMSYQRAMPKFDPEAHAAHLEAGRALKRKRRAETKAAGNATGMAVGSSNCSGT